MRSESMQGRIPTIKGIFVKSHINAVRKALGDEGARQLAKRAGQYILNIKNTDDIPVSEEIEIIKHALLLVSDKPIPPDQVEFEAGRFHFKNFSSTPLGRMIVKVFPQPTILLRAKYISEHVFRGISFDAERIDEHTIRIIMQGGNYHPDHFRGLFFQWITTLGFKVHIDAQRMDNSNEFIISWTP